MLPFRPRNGPQTSRRFTSGWNMEPAALPFAYSGIDCPFADAGIETEHLGPLYGMPERRYPLCLQHIPSARLWPSECKFQGAGGRIKQ